MGRCDTAVHSTGVVEGERAAMASRGNGRRINYLKNGNMTIHGNDLIVASTGNVIAAAKTCEVEVSADVVEVSRSTEGAVKHFVAGRTEWSMSVGCLVTSVTTVAALEAMVGTEQNVTFGVRGSAAGERLTGRAIVQRLRWTGTLGNLATYSATLQGTGALS